MYQADTRARVVIFDIAGLESSCHGLMSWPHSEERDLEMEDEQENNLCARAMQLNTYGSMVGLIYLSFLLYYLSLALALSVDNATSISANSASHTQELIRNVPFASIKSQGSSERTCYAIY